MNCRDIEPLLLAKRDGLLTSDQQTALSGHLAACPACQRWQEALNSALDEFKDDAARVPVPDAAEAWREVQGRLTGPKARPVRKRPLAPVIWFGASLAAAAAVALVYLQIPANPAAGAIKSGAVAVVAQADYVEAGNKDATTMVFSDQESGWLVVWAADSDAGHSG